MNAFADKTQENKSQSSSHGDFQSESAGSSALQFDDNKPVTVAQRKLQDIANNSPQVFQLKALQDSANNSALANETAQLQSAPDNSSFQQQLPVQKKENNTGLPDNLKSGIENLSGISLDDVKVHRNSDKPAHLQALAYAQGTDIHLGAGQEKHLPHEAWHVVQQKQGRVKPTLQMKDKTPVNDDIGLEKEADIMGARAENMTYINQPTQLKEKGAHGIQSAQLKSVKINAKLFGNHGVYTRDYLKQGIIPGGSEIEVDSTDCYMMEDKTYVRITNGLNLINFSSGGNLGDTDDLFVSDRAFSSEEEEAEEKTEDGVELSGGPITYQDGKVTIPILGQDLVLNKSGGALEGELPNEKFEVDCPNVNFDVDIPFAPGVYATAGLTISPSLGLELSGGSYKITAKDRKKSINIKKATVEGSIGLEITARLGVGAGVANIVGLDAGIFGAVAGKASLAGTLGGGINFTDNKYNLNLSINAAADIEGKVGAFVKAKLLGIFSAEKQYNLAEKTFAHFNYERKLTLGSSQNSLKPTLKDFTKKEYGDKSKKKVITVDGKTYNQLIDE